MKATERGIVYFSHVPHGFYEKQMRDFLSQFGTITNLRLGRSAKTGASKGYAFVEFKYMDVAKIVAETMNNYLMFEKLLKCELVAEEKVNKAIFRGKINPQKPPATERRLAAKKKINGAKSKSQDRRRLARQNLKLKEIQNKLGEYGIQMEIPKVKKPEDSSKNSTPKTGSKKALKSLATTPVMEIDDDDLDIKLKTPPHVKKVKSRPNSAAATPRGSRNNTPLNVKPNLAKLEKMLAMEKLSKTPLSSGKKGAKSSATTPLALSEKKAKLSKTPSSEKKAKLSHATPVSSGKKAKKAK